MAYARSAYAISLYFFPLMVVAGVGGPAYLYV